MRQATTLGDPAGNHQRLWPLWLWWCWLAGPEALAILAVAAVGRLPLLGADNHSLLWMEVGLVGAQVSLAAAVAAWGPWPLAVRIGASWVWGITAILTLCWCTVIHPSIDIVFCGLGLIQWVLVVAMFAAAWTFGIRLVDREQRIVQHNSVRQFSLQDLLLFTAEVAIALGLARAAWPDVLVRWRYFDWPYVIFYWLILTLGHVLLFNAVVTCFHVPRARWKNVLWTIFFAVLITGLEVFALWKLDNPGDPWLPHVFPGLLVNGTQLAWLLFALWRLERANVFLRRVFFPRFTRLRWPSGWTGEGEVTPRPPNPLP